MTFGDIEPGHPALLPGKLARFNWALLALIILTSSVGFAALYSVAGGSFSPWANVQIERFLVGMAIMFAIALTPVGMWKALAAPIYLVSLALLVAAEFYGPEVKGVQRWLEFGTLRIQPSEIAKAAVILALATIYSEIPSHRASHLLWAILAAAIILIPALLVFRQPDLGTAVIMVLAGGIVVFAAGVSYWYFAAILLLAAGAVGLVILTQGTEWQFLQDYQYARIETFLNPGNDPFGAGFHTLQSKIAIGAGGLEGRGYLLGTQSQLNFLPEKHTDFVFTTLAEEFGLILCLLLLAFYGLIIGSCIKSALNCRDRFSAILVIGFSGLFFLNVSANLAMVTGLAPVVGIPLPLISYGGTALLVTLASFGWIQGAHIQSRRDQAT